MARRQVFGGLLRSWFQLLRVEHVRARRFGPCFRSRIAVMTDLNAVNQLASIATGLNGLAKQLAVLSKDRRRTDSKRPRVVPRCCLEGPSLMAKELTT